MSSSNGLIRVFTLAILHGSSSCSESINKWFSFSFYMIALFLFSMIGTFLTYSSIEDNTKKEEKIINTIRHTMLEHNIIKVDNPYLQKEDYFDIDYYYEKHANEGSKYIHNMLIGSPLSAIVFIAFTLISFIIIFIPLYFFRTKIPDGLINGDANTLRFLKSTAKIIKNRCFFVNDDNYSDFANSYISGNNTEALSYVYRKHKNGIMLKLEDIKTPSIKENKSKELLKTTINPLRGKMTIYYFLMSCILFLIYLLLAIEGGLIWVIALSWFPLIVYPLYKRRKHQIFGSLKPSDNGKTLNEFFNNIGLRVIEEKQSQDSIETSFLTDEYIEQIKKEININENKSYFKINKNYM